MVRVTLASPLVVLLLLFHTSSGWSEKSSIPLSKNTENISSSSSENPRLEPSESKSRYKWRQGEEGRYILEEDTDNNKEDNHQKDKKYEEDQKDREYHDQKTKPDQSKTKFESLKPKLKSPVLKRRDKEDRHKDNNGREIYHKEKKKTIPLDTSGSKGKASGYIERHDEDRYVKEKDYFRDGEDDEDYDENEYNKEKKIVASLEPSESKWKKSKYKGRHGEGRYIMDEHDDYGKGGHGDKDGEFVEEHGNEEFHEEQSDRGYHNEDKKLDDETSKDYSIKGEDHEFKEGGASFDKHHKDIASENKENEHINEHDEGEKFGAEALKEHKLGKHREKSIGHKKHGFKNVYHKEEYGDHKTFHDEFLDNDHHHEYDDQHENRKLEGGRFSKGYLKEGENKEKDEGDEKHAWGKGGFDSKHDGHYEEGGHVTGHSQGHRKREGHHEADGHKHKHAKHKVKKGKEPEYHGEEHHPEYYSRSQKNHGGKEHKPVKSVGGNQYYGRDPEPYDEGDLRYPPTRGTKSRLPETTEDFEEPLRHDPAPIVDHGSSPSKSRPPPEHHSFYYRNPQTEAFDQVPLREEKFVPRVPQVHDAGLHNPRIVQPSSNPHNSGFYPTQLHDSGPHHGNTHHHGNHHHRHSHHDPRNNPQRHFVVSQPSRETDFQNRPHHSSVSQPFNWYKHSRRHGDPAQASSHHVFGHERAPPQQNVWVPQSKYRYSEPYENRASQQHYGYARRPEYQSRHRPY